MEQPCNVINTPGNNFQRNPKFYLLLLPFIWAFSSKLHENKTEQIGANPKHPSRNLYKGSQNFQKLRLKYFQKKLRNGFYHRHNDDPLYISVNIGWPLSFKDNAENRLVSNSPVDDLTLSLQDIDDHFQSGHYLPTCIRLGLMPSPSTSIFNTVDKIIPTK